MRDSTPSGQHARAGSMPHQFDGNGSGKFGEGGRAGVQRCRGRAGEA
jgi:hypothetical protein